MTERVDLMQFCSEERDLAYLSRPWTRGGYTFATNGHILVRVAARGDVPDSKKAPGTDRIFALQPTGPFVDAPKQKFPVFVSRPCKLCLGSGYEPDPEPGLEAEECEGCWGSGKVQERRSAKLGGMTFNICYLRQVWSLPGLLLGPDVPNDHPWFFRFDGGEGALMQMRGGHADHRDLKIDLPKSHGLVANLSPEQTSPSQHQGEKP